MKFGWFNPIYANKAKLEEFLQNEGISYRKNHSRKELSTVVENHCKVQ